MKFLYFFVFFASLAFADSNLTSDYNATLNANQLGMSYSDYNFSMAIVGVIWGVFFAYSILSVSLNIGRGK